MAPLLILFSIYFNIILAKTSLSNSRNVCPYDDGTFKCCSNYREVNGQCIECVGSWGIGCKYVCQKDTYGIQCIHKCRCKSGEICNRFNGCVIEDQRPHEKCNNNNAWWMVSVAIGSAFVTCVVWCIVKFMCKWRKLRKKFLGKDLRQTYEHYWTSPDLYSHMHSEQYMTQPSEIKRCQHKEYNNVQNEDSGSAVCVIESAASCTGDARYFRNSKSRSDIFNTENTQTYVDII